MDTAMAKLVKQKANHGDATMVVGDFNCKWGFEVNNWIDRALNE